MSFAQAFLQGLREAWNDAPEEQRESIVASLRELLERIQPMQRAYQAGREAAQPNELTRLRGLNDALRIENQRLHTEVEKRGELLRQWFSAQRSKFPGHKIWPLNGCTCFRCETARLFT